MANYATPTRRDCRNCQGNGETYTHEPETNGQAPSRCARCWGTGVMYETAPGEVCTWQHLTDAEQAAVLHSQAT